MTTNPGIHSVIGHLHRECHHGDVHLAGRIVRATEDVSKPSLALDHGAALHLRMLLGLRLHGLQHRAEVLRLAENDNGALAISPRQILEKLVDRLRDRKRPLPEFALADEQVLIVLPDEDVGLPTSIESLPARRTVVVAVELQQEVIADFLFIEFLESMRAALHHEAHAMQNSSPTPFSPRSRCFGRDASTRCLRGPIGWRISCR
jgi:hypothetical protein